jgi:hypothetical protein
LRYLSVSACNQPLFKVGMPHLARSFAERIPFVGRHHDSLCCCRREAARTGNVVLSGADLQCTG